MRKSASSPDRIRRRESGQALVEFALILPLFILLVVGIIQFGVGLNYWLDLNRVANQGARWAVVARYPQPVGSPDYPTCTTLNAPCTPNLQAYLESEPVSGTISPCVDISFPAGSANVGDPVKVKLITPFTFLPIVGLGTINLAADATMRIEQLPGSVYGAGGGGTTC